MSRIGKLPVTVPSGVEITVSENNLVTVKGPKGTLCEQISNKLKMEMNDGFFLLMTKDDSRQTGAQHGLARSLVNNMVIGVTDGYEKKLVIKGVGYKAEKKGDVLVMQLGYSHPVEMSDPEGISTEVTTPTEIIVRGTSKALVGNYAAVIRKWRKPEPYGGKGIRYFGENVLIKEGKTGK